VRQIKTAALINYNYNNYNYYYYNSTYNNKYYYYKYIIRWLLGAL